MYNPNISDSYISSTLSLNPGSFDQWYSAQPHLTGAHSSYIPISGTIEDYRSLQQHTAQSAGHFPIEYKKNPYRSTRQSKKSSAPSVSTVAANKKAAAQVRKLRKSENQIDVLRKYFKQNPKPGRESVSQLAVATGLKFLEVRNWFRNARLRNKDDNMKLNGKNKVKSELDDFGEVSSSTGSVSSMDISKDIMMLWDKLDNEEKKDLLPRYLTSWDKDSPDRTEAIRALIKCLSTTERNFVHGAVKPRGPYRCSSDKSLSKTTILERAKNAWKELERQFGANKREKTISGPDDMALNLDRDMLEGLKSLFQAHRDYLYYIVKEMGIDTADDKEMVKLKTPSSSVQRYGSMDEDHMFIPHSQYTSPSTMDLVQPGYSSQNLFPGYNAILPATPTPVYPGGDFMASYPYTQQCYTPASPVPLGGGMTSTLPTARSPWLPTVALAQPEDKAAIKPPYYTSEPGPDYSFVKNHFSPDKLSAHQPEKSSLIKPFSEMGGLAFNYNTATNYNPVPSSNNSNTEITQKCTLVKYYEVCTYNNRASGTPQTATKALPALPLPSSNSKFEQLH